MVCHRCHKYHTSHINLYNVRVQADRKRAAGGAKNKKFELTEEQKQEIREAFDLFDTDGSGISLYFTEL